MHPGLLAAGAALIVGGGTVTVIAAAPSPENHDAKVTRVVDGDTIDVSLNGETERVRLLNIDAPESVKPNSPVECLGPEASAFLKQLLPVGTPVALEYDQERIDGYGRTLAAVRLEDGTLANSAVATAGLAVPLTVGANDRFRPYVDASFAQAERDHKGFFSTDSACTVPAKTKKVNDAVTSVTAHPSKATAAQSAALAASAASLSSLLTAPTPGAAVRAVSVSGAALVAARSAVSTAHRTQTLLHPKLPESPATKAPRVGSTTAATAPRVTTVQPHSGAPRKTSNSPVPQPRRTYSPAPQPRRTTRAPAPAPSYTPPPVPKTHDPAPPNPDWHCRSYAPGGKTFKYIPCPK